ncbi:MAG: hypothetical protein KAX16_04915 [Actinomycetia bacterium]|nr:hypothetical protein [Actinomycetes bacterium]
MKKFIKYWILIVAVGIPALAMPVAAAAPLVMSADIADGAVTRNKIAYGAIDGDRIANHTISLEKLAALNVLSANIADGAVTFRKLGKGAVRRRNVANRSINKDKIAANSINSRRIADRSIKRFDLANSSVNSYKIIDNSIKGRDVKDGYLTGADLGNGSVGGDKLKDGSVTGADIADGSLTQSDLPTAVVAAQSGLRIETGETTISTWAQAPWINEATVSFSSAFSSPPIILVSFKNISNSAGTSAKNLVAEATTAQFTAKVKVTTGPPSSFATISWIAIGK